MSNDHFRFSGDGARRSQDRRSFQKWQEDDRLDGDSTTVGEEDSSLSRDQSVFLILEYLAEALNSKTAGPYHISARVWVLVLALHRDLLDQRTAWRANEVLGISEGRISRAWRSLVTKFPGLRKPESIKSREWKIARGVKPYVRTLVARGETTARAKAIARRAFFNPDSYVFGPRYLEALDEAEKEYEDLRAARLAAHSERQRTAMDAAEGVAVALPAYIRALAIGGFNDHGTGI